ncbi:MAG: hypothetical protein IH852_04400 [Bacteroidetes bacterium]|nr:hypothetical protein [Bacteroidota bacterium]
MASKELKEKIEAVKELTEIFKVERMVYLGVTIIALLMLLGSALSLIIKGEIGIAELGLLFGSSGMITYSTGRLLFMWNEALKLLYSSKNSKD